MMLISPLLTAVAAATRAANPIARCCSQADATLRGRIFYSGVDALVAPRSRWWSACLHNERIEIPLRSGKCALGSPMLYPNLSLTKMPS